MSWLLAYFKGGKIAALGAALLVLWHALASARRQGAAEQKAKEAERANNAAREVYCGK